MNTPATEPPVSFAGLGLAPPLLKALAEVGYEAPSPIQAAAIPLLLAGGDVLGQAQTGTGKTAAFALPALAGLELARREPQVLVVVPTRELAIQVAEAFRKYAAHLKGFQVLPVYGGQGYEPQLAALRRGPQVVVGTPGRLIDHLQRQTLRLEALRMVVLDEADEMLQMGFVEAIEEILARTPPECQVVLFSATMPASIRRIARRHLHEPQEVTIRARTGTVASTRQRYWLVEGLHKLDALTRILEVEPFDAMLVFARTKLATTELAERLEARGFAVAALNGDMVQAQRERTIAQLRAGKLDIVVATDVAARGIDVERISHVVNFDMPHGVESYVHRIGRTGRAGRSGEAILFVAPRERNMLRLIERHTRQTLEPLRLPTLGDVNAKRVAKFKARISGVLARGETTPYRSIIDELVQESGAEAADIAAALASLLQGKTPLLLARRSEESVAKRPSTRRREEHEARKPRRSRGRHHEEQQLYRLAVGRSHGIKVGNIVGAIANVGDIQGSDINGVDIQRDQTYLRLPAGLTPKTLQRIAEVKIRGHLLAIRAVENGPPPARNKKRR